MAKNLVESVILAPSSSGRLLDTFPSGSRRPSYEVQINGPSKARMYTATGGTVGSKGRRIKRGTWPEVEEAVADWVLDDHYPAEVINFSDKKLPGGRPLSKKKNPTHNIGPFSGITDFSLSPVDEDVMPRGRRISESPQKEIELTSGGMIRLRNPSGKASCPGCRGIIENPKVGTGKCSGCGKLVVIERDTSGFYQPKSNPGTPFFEADRSGLYTAGSPRGVANPHKTKGKTYQEVYDEWVDFLSDGKGKKALSSEELRHIARMTTESLRGKNPEGGFEYDFSGFYSQTPRGPYPVLNPKADIHIAVIPAEANGWRAELGGRIVGGRNRTVLTNWHRSKAEALKDARRMARKVGLSAKDVKVADDPRGSRELNPRHKKRRYSNPHSADIQKGTCPTCGANLILASGVQGGSCPKCQSPVTAG